ncbi:SDR family NAD(P)-dependent oxidoreductase [Segatella baroniae]|uniref:SDR family NAD(P)-dependent oxidoreductase n=1 Tax=Segatella baroniae TaxID=305719 RepID=UPI0004070905|nr:SDR family NAD(P)-dependent oxidoreductase [Segatella baroniae]
MKKILIVGGANGIGLSIATILAKRKETDIVFIVDKAPLLNDNKLPKMEDYMFDLTSSDYSFFDKFKDIDSLIITAGFGRLSLFKDIPESMIATYFNVNTIAVIRLIKYFYDKLLSKNNFYCGVMVSISGFMSSPFFSLYGATKAALKIFIESVNVEIGKSGSSNQILNVSPGSIKGTSFNGGITDLNQTESLAEEIIAHVENKDDLFIPDYEEVYKEVLTRYHKDFRKEGNHSYDYKVNSGRIKINNYD